jgi:hypothetical protein
MKKILSTLLGLGIAFSLNNAGAAIISLSPASTTASAGDSVSLDLIIGGLGDFAPDSLGDLDVDISYDLSVLTFDSYSLGGYLGDIFLGEALDLSFSDMGGGIINIAELSFLDADSTSGPSFFGPYLDDIQPDSFTLATLDFTVDFLLEGTSTIVAIDTINALGDGFGLGLDVEGTNDAIIYNPTVNVPEPKLWTLLLIGLIGLGFSKRKLTTCAESHQPQ